MTQKHTEHTDEQRHHPAAKHDEHRHETHAEHTGGHTVMAGNHEIKAEGLTAEDRKFIEQYADNLSPSTLRAKWIHTVGEKEDHPGQTLATRSPEVIKHWAEERGGTPATVPGTEHGDHVGVLRINFPGYGGQKLEAVTWDQWFQTFKDRKLVFLFQQQMRNGTQSNFFHMDSPLREHD